MEAVREAKEKFGQLIKEEFGRIERMKQDTEMTDLPNWTRLSLGCCREMESGRL